jgi:hypothetical protein
MHRSVLTICALVATATTLILAANAGAGEHRMPFTQTFNNPCTGEALVASGTLVLTETFTESSGGRFHERSRMSFHGTTARAVVTGAKYVVQEQTIEGTNSGAEGVPSTTHFRIKVHWVHTTETGALLDDDDFYDWWNIHLTINANGVPTSLKIDTEDDVCR